MQTDDELTRALGTAFRGATADLTYDRPAPRPRPTGLIAGPLVLAGVAGVALAVTAHGWTGHPTTAPQASAPVTVTAPSTTTPAGPVTRTLTLAGYSFTYTQAAGGAPFVARYESAVPSDATPVTVGQQSIPMGVDPATGTETAWLSSEGRYIAITSADATQDSLVALIGTTPRPIPAVS